MKSNNILPYDGVCEDFGVVIPDSKALVWRDALLKEVSWKNDEAIIFGKHITTKRKVAWYADKNFSYTYSKIKKTALLWTPTLKEIKLAVEKHCGSRFNSCLLNLYHNGSEGMAWHSDGEKELKKYAPIASLTLGETRRFCFKHKETKHKECLELENGSLVVMRGETQEHWLHRLPPTKKPKELRINLTFRIMEE